MDGDDMGQWVSGVKAAPLVNSLAEKAAGYFRTTGSPARSSRVLTRSAPALARDTPRFPMALANFSLYCAAPSFRAFQATALRRWRRVGGMVPARTPWTAAQALQP